MKPPHAERMTTPTRLTPLTPGWVRVVVKAARPDGSKVDRGGALALLADRPFADILVFRNYSRGMFVFEYDPQRLDALLAKRTHGVSP